MKLNHLNLTVTDASEARKFLEKYFGLRSRERGEDDNPHLFTSRQSGLAPMSATTIYGLFRRYANLAELPAERHHPHVLRHSIAVHLMNAGWDAADVQDWLGHRDIASTMVYAAVTNKRREAKYEEALLSEEIAANDAS